VPIDETQPVLKQDDHASEREATPPSRRQIIYSHQEKKKKARPYLIGGLVLLALILIIPTVAFVLHFVLPPSRLAVQVEDKIYTRGDVVNFIRFNQRLSEELGVPFQIGSSLFEALQTISDNEIAFQAAPRLGITVGHDEVDNQITALLGLPIDASADQETRANLEEKKRQFLNNVGLAEEVYTDIVRKELFRRGVRDAVGADVPRIQPQVHVYKIAMYGLDTALESQIHRRLSAGESIESVAKDVSVDPDVGRNQGEVGWFPKGVNEKLNYLIWGENSDGERMLPVGNLSDGILNRETQLLNFYYVAEIAEAREVDAKSYEVLVDQALSDFLNEQRKGMYVYMELNDRIYNWVNSQVRIGSLLPTPTPPSGIPGLEGLAGNLGGVSVQ
jgi:hypothetical protein